MIIEILDTEGLVVNRISADETFAEAHYPGAWRVSQEPESQPVTIPEDRKITKLAFLNRFTDAEAIALDLVSIGATVEAATMRRFLKKVDAATFIDLNRSDTRDGVFYLESVGLLSAGRALIILDSPINPEERPTK